MTVYFTGDIHGDPMKRLSFHRRPEMKDLTENDYLIITGDVGLFFSAEASYWPKYREEAIYQAEWLNNQKYTTIALCGNHDNRDMIKRCPQVDFLGGKARLLTFENKIYNHIYYIDEPTVLYIENETYLMIPGARSHDIRDGILEPEDPKIKEWNKDRYKMFRINHWSWWEDEKIDIDALKFLLYTINTDRFDYIVSHDGPIGYMRHYSGRARSWFQWEKLDQEEEFLDKLAAYLAFNSWIFGHYHFNDSFLENKFIVLYDKVIDFI